MNNSFYCTDTLSSSQDLDKIYFMDSSGSVYYSYLVPGRYKLSKNVKSCKDQSMKSLSSMVSVSIPANGYAYFYNNSQSVSPNLRLAGSYYTENTNSKSHSTGKYSGQTIIDYFNSPNFDIDCQCKIAGTNAEMCGNLYGTKKIGCSEYQNDSPPNNIPIPRPFIPDIQRGYSSSFWWLVWILFIFVGFIVFVMILLNLGVFNNMEVKADEETESLKLQESIK